MSFLAFLMLLTPPAVEPADFSAHRTATIFATIDRSEWCPAGNVRVDLVTGRFALTSGAPRDICHMENLQRPVQDGQLDDAERTMLRTAYTRAQKQGLSLCGGGKPPERIVVSNGGPALLLLTDGARTTAAPENLGCWTEGATELERTLNQLLGSRARPAPPPAP